MALWIVTCMAEARQAQCSAAPGACNLSSRSRRPLHKSASALPVRCRTPPDGASTAVARTIKPTTTPWVQHEPNTNRFAPLECEPEPDWASPDWSELPLDLPAVVFAKLGAAEVLMGAGLVCRPWLEAAKAPHVWRRVDMKWSPWCLDMKRHVHGVVRTKKNADVVCSMAKLAVDRCDGQMESFAGDGAFVTDELLKYIAKRSSCLKSLSLSCGRFSNQGLLLLITTSPLLEEIFIFLCRGMTDDAYQVSRGACPRLKRLVLYR